MRITSGISEAWRNICSGTTRATSLSLCFAFLVGLCITFDSVTILSEIHDSKRFQAIGASISVLSAPKQIDGSSCDRLTEIPGIRASGAIRQAINPLSLTALPDTDIPSWEATPGFTDLLHLGIPSRAGIFLSRELANQLAMQTGDPIEATQGKTRVVGIYDYPDDGRLPTLEYASVVLAPRTGQFDACWADIWPANKTTTSLLRTAITPTLDTEDAHATLRQLNDSLGETVNGYVSYQSRISRTFSIIAIILGFALGFTSLKTRRLELSSALHAGVSRRSQILQSMLETMTWIILGSLLTLPVISVILRSVNEPDADAIWKTELSIIVEAGLSAGLGAIAFSLIVREQDLFKYFKER